jgi:uncharacterized protein
VSPDEATTPGHLRWGRTVAVGLIAGFASGMFGVGGGIVIVPALALLVGFPHKLATGTSLSAIVPISLAGTIGYATAGQVDWIAAVGLSGGALAGAALGTRLLARVRTPWLQLAFAMAMLLTAGRMFLESADGTGRPSLTLPMLAGLIVLGVASGVLAGLLGVGGGVIIVPALTLAFGVPHVLAKGTSLAVILPTAVVGTIGNRRSQLTALKPASVVGAAGIGSALIASRLSLGLDPTVSRALFASLLVIVAMRLAHSGMMGLRSDRDDVAGDVVDEVAQDVAAAEASEA